MRVPGVEEALRALGEAEGVHLGSGASDDEISAAESELGLRFPSGYRAFLGKVGWARLDDVKLFGLGEGVPAELDLRSVAAELPDDLLPFARERDREILCLDPDYAGPYESPVYRCSGGRSLAEGRDYAGHDFASWLWMTLAR